MTDLKYAGDLSRLKAPSNELHETLMQINERECGKPGLDMGDDAWRPIGWAHAVEISALGYIPRGDGTQNLSPARVAEEIPEVQAVPAIAQAILAKLK